MSNTLTVGLNLRSPDHQLTFRNRVAKQMMAVPTSEVKKQAAEITGRPEHSFNRREALGAIAKQQLDAILAGMAI